MAILRLSQPEVVQLSFSLLRTARCALLPAVCLGACLFAPMPAHAQAGSRPAVLFDTPDPFYHSLQGSGAVGQPGHEAVVPAGVWMLPAATRYLMWVELEQGRLNILEQLPAGGLMLRKRIPVSIGKQGIGKDREGDQKTPIGTYRITSFLNDGALDDFYGPGAYPLNYPNALDRRLARTGHGIWLHGLPKGMGERPFLDSDGCVVIDNESLLLLAPVVAAGLTQIVLSREPIRWVPLHEQQRQGDALEQALLEWERAWEARDAAAYEAWYAEDFSDFARNKRNWAKYKRAVNAGKAWIRLELSDISMLVDPAEQQLVTVRYFQDYASDNYNWKGWKEQIWRHGDRGWQIIYEGNG